MTAPTKKSKFWVCATCMLVSVPGLDVHPVTYAGGRRQTRESRERLASVERVVTSGTRQAWRRNQLYKRETPEE